MGLVNLAGAAATAGAHFLYPSATSHNLLLEQHNAHHAGRADQDQVLDMLRVLQRVGGRQVAAQGVAHQDHLVHVHGFPPALQRAQEEVLRVLPRLCWEARPACRTPYQSGFATASMTDAADSGRGH